MSHYEEKARELFNKYLSINLSQVNDLIDGIRISLAKKCALILVDEILIELEYIDDSAMVPYEYWVEVKKEIEKL